MTVDVECLAPWAHYIAKPIWRSDSRNPLARDSRRGLTEPRFGSAEVLNRNLIEDLNQPGPRGPDILTALTEIPH